jgi:hypothetical protein
MLHRGQPAAIQLQRGAELGFTDLRGMKKLQGLSGSLKPADPESRVVAGFESHAADGAAVEAYATALHG